MYVLTKEFHISPVEQRKLLPEDKADLLSMYNLQANIDAEKSAEEKRKERRKKGSRLQQMEDSLIAQNNKVI
jgi:hypothetical protein